MTNTEPINSKNKLITILIHVLAWGVIWTAFFIYQPLSWGIVVPYQLWIKQGVVLVMLLATFYVNATILVPRYLLKNKTGEYFLLMILLVVAVMVINGLMDPWLNLPKLMDQAFHHRGPEKRHGGGGGGRHGVFDVLMLVIVTLVLGISTSVTAIQKWQHDQRVKQDLEQQKTISELSFLKAQINPHFFFNTLNNIYALTVVNVEQSREAIHKLSRMMRYLLYETEQDVTLLSKEVGFIRDYIDLMQLRLTEKVNLTFDFPQSINDVQIAPMIFLPFVENAFKHGISATQQSDILIRIVQKESDLEMTVENRIYDERPQSMEGSGIGLVNTRRRLDLLYPDQYALEINEDLLNKRYKVNLILHL